MISRFEQAVLLSVCAANKGSKTSHVPKAYFMKKFQKTGRIKRHAERALLTLKSLGYVSVHPTRGETTYGLTQQGLDTCRELRDKGLTVSRLLTSE
jgi:hypothetical protein